jgi:hypothetical protein
MSTPDSETLTPDNIFEILSNHRRRLVLFYLRKHEGGVEVKELAREIAAMENDVSIGELTSQQRKRVYVSLYQTHLPKLAQMQTIEYDKDAGTVRLPEQTNNIDRYLSGGEQVTYPWLYHYLVLGVISASALVLSLIGLPVFESLPLPWLSLGVIATFAVSAVVQLVIRRQHTDEIPFELSQFEKK